MAEALRILCISGLVLLLAGCGKKKEVFPPAVAAQAPSENQADPPVAVVVGGDATAESALSDMTDALRSYVVSQHRTPASLQEVVRAGYLQGVPEPPAGKQYGIDKAHMTVVLEKKK